MVPIKLGLVGPGNILQINMLLEFSPFSMQNQPSSLQNTPYTLHTPPSNSFPSYNFGYFTTCSLGAPLSRPVLFNFGGLAGCPLLPPCWEPLGVPTDTVSSTITDTTSVTTTIELVWLLRILLVLLLL